MKDWTGNANSIWSCHAASNHSDSERQEDDYYATEPKAVELLLELEKFKPCIWECACGGGNMSKVLTDNGYVVWNTDIVDRGCPDVEILDFLKTVTNPGFDIVTNPPYKFAKEFVEHALDISADGTKVAMFLKLTFLEGKARKELFGKNPPKTVWVSSSRLKCARNGEFEGIKGTAVAYAWYVWVKGYKGDTVVKWFN